ncbi:MAG: hypothetical protein ACKOXJ_01160 [Alphaproteobacteria bacterium]
MTKKTINDSLNQSKSGIKSFLLTIKKSTKNIFSSRIFLAIFFLLIGVLTTNSCQKIQEQKRHHHSFFDDDFYEDDFFAEFDELHKKMRRSMINHHRMLEKSFADDFANSEKSKNTKKISASLNYFEDESFMNYELNFSGINPENINVLIENNYLIFSAKKAEIKNDSSENKLIQSSSQSDFYYATNLTNYDEKLKPEITKTNDKILVKLKKSSPKKLEEKNTKKPLKKS